jgi:hypothetical protein
LDATKSPTFPERGENIFTVARRDARLPSTPHGRRPIVTPCKLTSTASSADQAGRESVALGERAETSTGMERE